MSDWSVAIPDAPFDWELIPLDGRKRPIVPETGELMTGWQDAPGYDVEGLCALNGQVKAVGLKLGPASGGILAVDFDGPGSIEKFEEVFGHDPTDLPPTVGMTSGRELRGQRLFQVDQDWWPHLRGRRSWSGEDGNTCLELRWAGHQSVIAGAHPKTKGYSWLPESSPSECDVATAPEWLLEPLVHQPPTAAEVVAPTAVDAKRVPAMLACIDPLEHTSYDDWLQVGMAMHNTDPGLLKEWVKWSKQMPNFDEGECLRKWESFSKSTRGSRLTIASLHDWAKDGGYKEPKRKPAAEPLGAAEGVEVKDTDWIKEQLQECLDDGLDSGQMAVEVDRIADEADVYPARVKDLLSGLRAAEVEAEQAADVSSVISQTDAADQAVKSIKLEDYLPPTICSALKTFQRGIPYQDLTLLVAQLVQVSSVLKLGTRINGNFFTDWEVPLNFYGVAVGPSGARKSPLVKAIFSKPAEEIRSQLDRLNNQRFEAWETECKEKRQNKPKPPRNFTHTTNEYTGEGLADQLAAHEGNGLPLLVLRDEIAALFESFGKYKQGGKGTGGDEQQLLEIFDGDGFHSLRVGNGRSYSRCHVSVYGGIQDSVLRRLISSGDANGKWARCVFVPLPEMTYLLSKPDAQAKEERRQAEKTLRNLSTDLFRERPRVFELNEEGIEMILEFDFLCQKQRNEASIPAIKALKNKAAGKALRIAGLLHLLQCQEAGDYTLEVPTARLVEAIQLIQTLDDWTAAFHASATLQADQAQAVTEREQIIRRMHEVALKAKGQMTWTESDAGLAAERRRGSPQR